MLIPEPFEDHEQTEGKNIHTRQALMSLQKCWLKRTEEQSFNMTYLCMFSDALLMNTDINNVINTVEPPDERHPN